MHPVHELVGRQRPLWLNDRPLAVQPAWLDRVEPRAFHRQPAHQDPDPAGALHRAVMRPNPRPHRSADVPGGVVPHQHPHALALRGEPAGTPGQKVGGDAADRATLDKAQQHSILIGAQQPVAGQSLGLPIVLGPRFGVQPQRLAPGVHRRLRQAAPPDLVGIAHHPVEVAGCQADQAVTPVFLSAYCGSGLVIHVFARRQPTSSRLSASRMVSRLTRSAGIPCSTQTSAARASVQVERALPNCRGLWCKSALSRWLRSASKSLAAVRGRRDCMATTANPRVSNARRTLRTACGLHPMAWAITVVVSPRAEAKSMWQRRTVNPSDDRRPACKAWRSGPLNSRTKRGFIPQHMTQARHPNNVRWNCTSLRECDSYPRFVTLTFSSAAPSPFASFWASSLAQKCMKNS